MKCAINVVRRVTTQRIVFLTRRESVELVSVDSMMREVVLKFVLNVGLLVIYRVYLWVYLGLS